MTHRQYLACILLFGSTFAVGSMALAFYSIVGLLETGAQPGLLASFLLLIISLLVGVGSFVSIFWPDNSIDSLLEEIDGAFRGKK